jgi:hypothetical protein
MKRSTLCRVRGVIVTLVLIGPLVASMLTAIIALADQFVSGWMPSSWFSSEPVDWIFGTGVEGSANNYLVFMVSALVASVCVAAIRWAFDCQETSG